MRRLLDASRVRFALCRLLGRSPASSLASCVSCPTIIRINQMSDVSLLISRRALRFDVENRPKTDAVYVFDTRGDGSVASRITKLKIDGFSGVNGDGSINLHGIGVHIMPSTSASAPDEAAPKPSLRLFLNNHRPTLGANGQPVDNHKTGANSTVEIFETTLGSDSMRHVKTFHNPLIRTPNRVAPVGPNSFLFSNDHYLKTGHQVSRTLCDAVSQC